MDRDILHHGFILHSRPYSNTSLLLECFTENLGRFPALAKGVKSRKGNAAVLRPFQPLLFKVSGRGEVRVLSLGEAVGPELLIKGRALYCGFYINELLMRLLGRNDPHAKLYREYRNTLGRLSGGDDLEIVLRRFEISLLRELGYAPNFDHVVGENGMPAPDSIYHYQIETGVVPAGPSAREAVSGRTLLALAGHAGFGSDEKRQARKLMRGILAHYLGSRPLKSRELFQSGKCRS